MLEALFLANKENPTDGRRFVWNKPIRDEQKYRHPKSEEAYRQQSIAEYKVLSRNVDTRGEAPLHPPDVLNLRKSIIKPVVKQTNY